MALLLSRHCKCYDESHGKESPEATSENSHRGCGRDMLGQTDPSTSSSNRESPITDDGQPCMADRQ